MNKARSSDSNVTRTALVVISTVTFVLGLFTGIMVMGMKQSGPQETGGQSSMPAATETQTTDQFQEEIAALEEKVSQDPDLESWIRLGNLYFDTGRHEKAIWAYEKSLEIDPDNANVWTDLGVMYRRNGQPGKAVESFERAIEVDPTHEIARFNKGIIFMHDLNDRQAALTTWEELVAMNPFATTPSGQLVSDLVKALKQSQDQ